MYNITITPRAERDIKKLDRTTKNRIVTDMMVLASDPRPPGCVKVESEKGVWRIRSGDYRIGYTIDDTALEVAIVRVAPRSEFYG